MTARHSISLSVLLTLLTYPQMLLAESAYHQHHVAVVGGFVSHHGRNANYLGLDYEYRLNEQWGIGGFYEQTLSGFDIEALGITVVYHLRRAWIRLSRWPHNHNPID